MRPSRCFNNNLDLNTVRGQVITGSVGLACADFRFAPARLGGEFWRLNLSVYLYPVRTENDFLAESLV
jgi:hypothetical protein